MTALLLFFCFWLWAVGQEQFTPLSNVPVAVKGSEIGDLLLKWFSSGTAAGNSGDYYDNRDGGHSLLNIAPYPQLQKVEYTQDEIKSRHNWGMQQKVLPFVVFGNSSTSASPEQGGSNVRSYYTDPRGLAFLFAEYAGNNLYIYPEHMDHDPGHNGAGGYGDLFPTNTPYLITSQGSSGSDQPFMNALPHVLAAFRPEVKKKLVQSGLLMPTLQMILRITSRNLAGSKDYITGKAHPTVFEGSNVNALAMVELAHGITLSNLPPIAVIQAVKEATPVNGVDYFEPGYSEKLADTPAVIARILRGTGSSRKIVVSAENSKDLNNRPLKFHWAILRGDPDRIKIEYLNASQSVAEITIPYQNRSAIEDNPSLESNRIDIGIFVHNGAYYSPPAFLTMYSLDNESRTYAVDGRPLDIGYGAGSSRISVLNWQALFDALESGSDHWMYQILQKQIKADQITALIQISSDFKKQHKLLLEAQQTLEKCNKEDTASINNASQAVESAKRAESEMLQRKIPKLNLTALELVQNIVAALVRNPGLFETNAAQIEVLYQSAGNESRTALDQARKKIVQFGLADNSEFPALRLRPVVKGTLTQYERNLIEEFNATLLDRILFPGIVEVRWRENYVDQRLAAKKGWRDIYRYAPDGTPIGWRRYLPERVFEFNAEGLLIMEKDAQGRCIRGRAVRYESEPDGGARRVKMIQTDSFRSYEYSGPADWKGHVITGTHAESDR